MGGTTPLSGLTLSGGATDTITNALSTPTSINTNGSQTYNDALNITTSGNTTLAASGASSNITLGNSISWSTTNTVELSAGQDIIVNGDKWHQWNVIL